MFYSYVSQVDSYEERARQLIQYGFACKCRACENRSPESDALRRELERRIYALMKLCNDLMGGLMHIGSNNMPIGFRETPRKPFNPTTQGPKLRKDVLEPLLRLQADIEKEGLDNRSEVFGLWKVLARAWEGIPGKYGATKSSEARKALETHLQTWAKLAAGR